MVKFGASALINCMVLLNIHLRFRPDKPLNVKNSFKASINHRLSHLSTTWTSLVPDQAISISCKKKCEKSVCILWGLPSVIPN
jgi:hypothetical protein